MRQYNKYVIAGLVIVTVALLIVGIYTVKRTTITAIRQSRDTAYREYGGQQSVRTDNLSEVWNRLNRTKYCVKNKTYTLDNNTICLWGYANPMPKSNAEIRGSSYNSGSIIMQMHPLLFNLEDSSLSLRRDWWQLPNVISIVSGYNRGEYLILNEDGLWYSTNSSILHLTDEVFDLIFKYKDTPYCLANGQIRKGLSKIEHERNNSIIYDSRSPYWSWEPIRVLASSDITGMYIADLSVADSGEILLVDSDYRTHLINSHNRLSIELESEEYISNTRTIGVSNRKWYHLPVWRIKLGQSSKHFLIFYNHDAALVENDIILYTVSNIKDAVIHPHDKYSIIVVDKYDYIVMYKFGDDNNSKAIDLSTNSRKRQAIDGRASALLSLDDTKELFIISPENMILRL